MATCFEIELLISRSMDEPLTDAEQATMQAHLAACPACCALRDDFLTMHDCLETFAVEPPPSLHEKLLHQLDEAVLVPIRPRKQRLRHFATAAASLAVLISAVVLGPKLLPTQTTPNQDNYALSVQSPSEQTDQAETVDLPEGAAVMTPEDGSASPETAQNESAKNQTQPPAKQDSSPPAAQAPQNQPQPDAGVPRSVPASEPPPDPMPFAISGNQASTLITQADAEALLFDHCSQLGMANFTLRFSHVSSDGLSFYFLCTYPDGQEKTFCVSASDGAIAEVSTTDEHVSTSN